MSNPLAEFVRSRFVSWRNARSAKELQWLAFYRTYRCIADAQDATKKSERSQIKIPATKEAVRNFVYSADAILFPSDPWFWLDPTTTQTRSPSIYAQYIRYLMQKEQFTEKIDGCLTEDAVYGTVIGRVLPVKYKKKKQVRQQVLDPMTGQPTQEVIVPQVTELVLPRFDSISIFNYYTNPTATGVRKHESEGGVVRHMLSEAQLQQMLEEGTINRLPGVPKLEDSTVADTIDALPYLSAPIQDASTRRAQTTGTQFDGTNTLYTRLQLGGIQPNSDQGFTEILEWHGYIPESTAREASEALGREITPGEKILWVFADEVLNDDIELPEWMDDDRPFVCHRFEPLPGEFYGLGIVESASGPQKALDATVRARIDNLAISLNAVFAINEQKMVPGQNLDVHAGKVFKTFGDVREAIQQFTIGDVTGPTYPASQQYEQWINSAHGVSPILGGRQARGGEQTATEISTMAGNAAGFVAKVANSFENSFLEPILRMYSSILFRFPNPEQQFAVVGPEGVQVLQIESTDMPPDAQFVPMGSIAHQAQAKSQKIQNALAVTANPLDAPFVNRPALLKQYFDGLGLSNTDNIVFAPPVPPIVQSMMQAQLMGAGGSGGGSPPSPAPESGQPGSQLEPVSAPGGTPAEVA